LTYIHPLNKFFRATFAKILRIPRKDGQQLVFDEFSKNGIQIVKEREKALIKQREDHERASNRKVILGSFTARSILDKFIQDDNSVFIQKNSRSIKRQKYLLSFLKSSKKPDPILPHLGENFVENFKFSESVPDAPLLKKIKGMTY
jgi:hypothetical protein